MIHPIVLFGDPVLKRKAENIPHGEDVKQLIADMYETMNAASGVGLAAPQIGKSIRLFIVDSTPLEEKGDPGIVQAFLNAELIEANGKPWVFEEGCLSIPGIREDVSRPEQIKIKFFDEDWNEHIRDFDDIHARIIQHEYDHIDGVLFTDHISAFKKRLLKSKLGNISKGKIRADYRVKAPLKR